MLPPSRLLLLILIFLCRLPGPKLKLGNGTDALDAASCTATQDFMYRAVCVGVVSCFCIQIVIGASFCIVGGTKGRGEPLLHVWRTRCIRCIICRCSNNTTSSTFVPRPDHHNGACMLIKTGTNRAGFTVHRMVDRHVGPFACLQQQPTLSANDLQTPIQGRKKLSTQYKTAFRLQYLLFPNTYTSFPEARFARKQS